VVLQICAIFYVDNLFVAQHSLYCQHRYWVKHVKVTTARETHLNIRPKDLEPGLSKL